MALAVILCMSEIQLIGSADKEQHQQESTSSLGFLQQVFPSNYCVFEKVRLMINS